MLWFLLHFIQVRKEKKRGNNESETAKRTTFGISTKPLDQKKDSGGRKMKD